MLNKLTRTAFVENKILNSKDLKPAHECSNTFEEEMNDQVYCLRRMIAKNCIYLRKVAGVTQVDLANKIGLSQSHINYVESGLGNPSVGILAKIAKGLQIEMTEFFVKSIWEVDQYSKDSFSIIKGPKVEMKKLAVHLPEGWDFQSIFIEKNGEFHISAKKKNFRQFFYCRNGFIKMQTSEGEIVLAKEEGIAITGSQSLRINTGIDSAEVIHLCYREK